MKRDHKPQPKDESKPDPGAFERVVDYMLKTPPKPHKSKARPASKGRVRKGKSRT